MTFLGKRLKELRGARSLHSVGKDSGIAPIDVSRYEQGIHLPTVKQLKKLAEYFQVSYEDLRVLYYKDYFVDPEEKAAVLKWAREELLSDSM